MCLIVLAYIVIGLLGLFFVFPISRRLGHTISLQPDEYGDDDWSLIIVSSLGWPVGLAGLFFVILCLTYSRLVHTIEHYWDSKYDKKENI